MTAGWSGWEGNDLVPVLCLPTTPVFVVCFNLLNAKLDNTLSYTLWPFACGETNNAGSVNGCFDGTI